MKILLTEIDARAKDRPLGYKADLMSKGSVKGDFLEIGGKEYMDLYRKYNPTLPTPNISTCCANDKPPMPPMATQIINASKAAGRVITSVLTGQRVLADPKTIEDRKTACSACEFLNGKRCSKCGCWYEKKIQLLTEHCPERKW